MIKLIHDTAERSQGRVTNQLVRILREIKVIRVTYTPKNKDERKGGRKRIRKKKERKKSENSSDSSDLIDFAIKHKNSTQTLQQSEEKKH